MQALTMQACSFHPSAQPPVPSHPATLGHAAMMTPMLFSVSFAGYWGQHRLSLPEFFRKAAALGYRSVELGAKRPHLSPLDYRDAAVLAELKQAAVSAGVEIGTIAAYTDFTVGHGSPEVPLVEMQVAYVREAARMAQALGAKIVRVFSGYYTQPSAYQQDWNRCVAALRESAEVASEYGVVVGLQNHHDVGVSVEAYVELLDEVNHPNLRAMFDPWSIALHGANLYEAARLLAPRHGANDAGRLCASAPFRLPSASGELREARAGCGAGRAAGGRIHRLPGVFRRTQRGRIPRLRGLRNVFAAARRRRGSQSRRCGARAWNGSKPGVHSLFAE